MFLNLFFWSHLLDSLLLYLNGSAVSSCVIKKYIFMQLLKLKVVHCILTVLYVIIASYFVVPFLGVFTLCLCWCSLLYVCWLNKEIKLMQISNSMEQVIIINGSNTFNVSVDTYTRYRCTVLIMSDWVHRVNVVESWVCTLAWIMSLLFVKVSWTNCYQCLRCADSGSLA